MVRLAKTRLQDSQTGVGSLTNIKLKEPQTISVFGKLHKALGLGGDIIAAGAGEQALHLLPMSAKIVGGTVLLLRGLHNYGYKNIKQLEQDIILDPGKYSELFRRYANNQDIPLNISKRILQNIKQNLLAIAATSNQNTVNK